jgi:isocitrate/isopropylmalate dehydrogenase
VIVPVLPGDGIGPIVIEAAVRVLRAAGAPVEFETYPFGLGAFLRTGQALPPETEAAVRAAGVALLGAATTPERGCASPILALRRRLGLDVLVRPVEVLGITVVCHAAEGLYAAPESEDAVAVRRLTAAGCARVLGVALERAERRVTVVDKPTVFRASAALWRDAIAAATPAVPVDLLNADAFVAALVRDPRRFEVVVAESFTGDVLSDLVAALGDGMPRAPSIALGRGCAVFEPVHGSAPRHAGDDPPRVTPVGAVRAGALLLRHLGHLDSAARIEAAVAALRTEGPRTPDQGGTATTGQVTEALVARLP